MNPTAEKVRAALAVEWPDLAAQADRFPAFLAAAESALDHWRLTLTDTSPRTLRRADLVIYAIAAINAEHVMRRLDGSTVHTDEDRARVASFQAPKRDAALAKLAAL